MEGGWSNQFFLSGNGPGYVAVSDITRRSNAQLSHLIARRVGKAQIRYFDRNPLNLRPENLWQRPWKEGTALDAYGKPLPEELLPLCNGFLPPDVAAKYDQPEVSA